MDRRCLPGVGLTLGLLSLAAAAALAAPRKAPPHSSRAVFERRILPLLNAPNPSSCAECHLSGVDLKDYIRSSEAETYASLVKQGLVDARRPANSKLLRLIRMAKPKSALLTQRARETEYAAFATWLAAASQNQILATGTVRPIGPKVSDAVIRHTRQDQVLASFTRNIWSQEGRCAGCHGRGTPGAARFAKQHGDRMGWLIPNDPEATLEQLLAQKAIDTEKPDRSPLILKGIGELGHGGGVKFVRGDRTYQLFLTWLQDYGRTVKGSYRDAQSLPSQPAENLVTTGSVLEIVDGPEKWIGKNLRVDLFAWNEQRSGWSTAPAATADRLFNRGHGSLLPVVRIVDSGSAEEQSARKTPLLPVGRYLLKFYLGQPSRAGGDTQTTPGLEVTYLGAMEVTAEWKPGRDAPTRVTPVFK